MHVDFRVYISANYIYTMYYTRTCLCVHMHVYTLQVTFHLYRNEIKRRLSENSEKLQSVAPLGADGQVRALPYVLSVRFFTI